MIKILTEGAQYRKREYLFLLILLSVFCFTQSVDLNSPFIHHNESQGCYHGILVRNFLKYGLLETKGAPLSSSGPIEYYDSKPYKSDHPFLPSLLIYGSFLIFGVHEWSMRIVFLIFALLGIVLFYLLARRLLETRLAVLLAVTIFALNPAYGYHSVVTGHQIPTLVFILLSFHFYFLWRESNALKHYLGILLSMFLACNMDWPGYYAAVVLFAYHFFVEKKNRVWAVGWLLANLIFFALYLFHLYLLDPQALGPLKLLLRAGTSRSFLSHSFGMGNYIASKGREVALYFTLPVLFLSVLWLMKCLCGKRSASDFFVLATLLLGLDEIIFLDVCYNHDYYSYYLVVFFTLSATKGIIFLSEQSFRWGKTLGIAVMVVFSSGFFIQSALVLHNRFTKVGAWEFYYKLAQAVSDKTAYQDKIIVACDNVPWYTPFYADRYFLTYDSTACTLIETGISEPLTGMNLDAFKEFVLRNEKGVRWVVMTSSELVEKNSVFFQEQKRALKDREKWEKLLHQFSIEIEGSESELFRFLNAHYPKETYKGFIFFRLK